MNLIVIDGNGQLGNERCNMIRNSVDKYILTYVVNAFEESITMLRKQLGEDISANPSEFFSLE